MAEDFLEEIYKESKLLCEIRQIVEYAKTDDSHHAVMLWNQITPQVFDLCKEYLDVDKEKGIELWNEMKKLSLVGDDLVFLGDLFEHSIIPLLEEKMLQWGSIETENEEGDYLFETSVSGFVTVKDLQINQYLHSKVDPMWEAKKRTKYIFNPKYDSYYILGCGLGYLLYQLYVVTDGSAMIHVFERDARMVEYARSYGVLAWIPEDRLKVVVDTDIMSFLKGASQDGVGFYIFPPALKRQPEEARAVLEGLCVQYNTYKRFMCERQINAWRNIKSGNKFMSQFDVSSLSKEYVIIAAGPSLDDSLDFLRACKGKKTLLAVGTVFKKLIENDIIPDMIVVADPQARTYRQIEGLEDQKVPLFIGMSAYWKFAASYQGDKYMIPTNDMEEIITYAKENEQELCRSAGTVTAVAVEVANKLGAEAMYLVGVDLAYPNGVSHATGTLDRKIESLDKFIEVNGVGNTKTYSNRVFIGYREELEKTIASTPHITYYNMSRIGAQIAGTKDGTALFDSYE